MYWVLNFSCRHCINADEQALMGHRFYSLIDEALGALALSLALLLALSLTLCLKTWTRRLALRQLQPFQKRSGIPLECS